MRHFHTPPASTAGDRYLLWRALRAMVRAGDSEGADAIAVSLGYTKRRNRKTLIEAIHQRIRREAAAANDLADVRAELEQVPAQATPKRATDKQSRHR